MAEGIIFVAIGFLCGFFLRFVPFAIVVVLSVVAYIVKLGLDGESGRAMIVPVLVAIVGLQVGYFIAIAFRTCVIRSRGRQSRGGGGTTVPDGPANAGGPFH